MPGRRFYGRLVNLDGGQPLDVGVHGLHCLVGEVDEVVKGVALCQCFAEGRRLVEGEGVFPRFHAVDLALEVDTGSCGGRH